MINLKKNLQNFREGQGVKGASQFFYKLKFAEIKSRTVDNNI
jgi:hypothetical protein